MSDNDRKVVELRNRFIASSAEEQLSILARLTAALIRAEQCQTPKERWLNSLGRRASVVDVVVCSN